MKIAVVLMYLVLPFIYAPAFAGEQEDCVKAEELAHDCCSNPKSCMSNGELEDAQKLDALSRIPANEDSVKEIKELKTDLNHDAIDNCHKAVRSCKFTCSDVDVKRVQKCEQHSDHSDMFKQQMNSVIIPGAIDDEGRK